LADDIGVVLKKAKKRVTSARGRQRGDVWDLKLLTRRREDFLKEEQRL
jgi:hypothetical protein